MINKIVDDFLKNLEEKEKTNEGFPNTESMKIALFGQLAFKYEQDCQDIYKTVKDKVLKDCEKEINELLDQTSWIKYV